MSAISAAFAFVLVTADLDPIVFCSDVLSHPSLPWPLTLLVFLACLT